MLANPWLKPGKYRVPVLDLRVTGGRIYLKTQFNRELIDEFKASLDKPKFHKDLQNRWSCLDSPRSRFVLEVLSGGNPYDKYDADLSEQRPRRDCLYAHQVEMLRHCLTRRRAVLAAEMGTGKTLAAIEVMEASGHDDWLWVGPKSALAAVALEFIKWEAEIIPVMMTYEKFRRALEKWDGSKPWRGIVFDESSRLKSPRAKRTQAALHVSNEMAWCWEGEEYLILMTGTPAPKNPLDWWAQCEVACPGFLRENSTFKLRDRIAYTAEQDFGNGKFTQITGWREDEVVLLSKRMEGLTLVKLKKDCLDLPEKRYEPIAVETSTETTRVANLIARTAESAIQALTNLRELSDGFQYMIDEKDGSRKVIRTDSPKDKMLLELIERHDEVGRLVVYAGFHATIDKLCELIHKAGWSYVKYDGRGLATSLSGIDSLPDALREFQEGEAEKLVFVAHPASGGMGLTLTASPSIVYYSNDFSAESRIQSEDRIHRPGMDAARGATIFDLIHLPTDELVLENLKLKRDLQSLTLGEVQAAL